MPDTATTKRKTVTALTAAERNELMSLLGEGFHTAFRKATSHERAYPIWTDIRKLPTDEWGSVLDFVMGGIEPFLNQMLAKRG